MKRLQISIGLRTKVSFLSFLRPISTRPIAYYLYFFSCAFHHFNDEFSKRSRVNKQEGVAENESEQAGGWCDEHHGGGREVQCVRQGNVPGECQESYLMPAAERGVPRHHGVDGGSVVCKEV